MEKFDDTLQKAREAFDSAYKKTEDVITIQKIKFQLAGKKSELDKAYSALGKICYSSAVKDESLPSEAFNVMKRITDITAEIDELQLQISKAQGKAFCTNCNSAIPAGSAFCNFCGKPTADK